MKPSSPCPRRCAGLLVVLIALGSWGCLHTAPRAGTDVAGAATAGKAASPAPAGAVSVLEVEDVDEPVVRAPALLQGRVAGVQVLTTPGGGISVRIRGVSTFYGNAEPLYVVDGLPVQVTSPYGMDWLNPADIDRIEVLKDAAATAVYGMRGANGVVLITTRRGR